MKTKKVASKSTFLPPTSGEMVPIICINCDYFGFGKLANLGPFVISEKLKNSKCPKCGKHKLIMNPFVMY